MIKEIENYLVVLGELRGQLKNAFDGLPAEALDWRPIEGEGALATNSMAALLAHLAGSETFWMKEIIGGQPIQRDREAEFVTRGVRLAALMAKLEEAAKNTERILASLTLARLEESRKFRDRLVTVRWCILHVIEHTAMHIGHMQLTRQLWLAKLRK